MTGLGLLGLPVLTADCDFWIAIDDGRLVQFEPLWDRRQAIDLGNGVSVAIPALDDLILTKHVAPRPKDLEDIRLPRSPARGARTMSREEAAASVAHLVDRQVSVAELREAISRPLTAEERDEILSLARWFCRRYPTPLQRLAYVRRAYRRWQGAG